MKKVDGLVNRVKLLETLNSGVEYADLLSFKELNDTNPIWKTWKNLKSASNTGWTGGDEWTKFKNHLSDEMLTKPLEGYYDEQEECWFVTQDDIDYYVMTYLMLEIKNYQSINFKVTTLMRG